MGREGMSLHLSISRATTSPRPNISSLHSSSRSISSPTLSGRYSFTFEQPHRSPYPPHPPNAPQGVMKTTPKLPKPTTNLVVAAFQTHERCMKTITLVKRVSQPVAVLELPKYPVLWFKLWLGTSYYSTRHPYGTTDEVELMNNTSKTDADYRASTSATPASSASSIASTSIQDYSARTASSIYSNPSQALTSITTNDAHGSQSPTEYSIVSQVSRATDLEPSKCVVARGETTITRFD